MNNSKNILLNMGMNVLNDLVKVRTIDENFPRRKQLDAIEKYSRHLVNKITILISDMEKDTSNDSNNQK